MNPTTNFDSDALKHHWMPFTANRDFSSNPRIIVKGEGVYLWNHKGERLIDGSSGLFNVAAGHSRKEIADAVHAQMLQNSFSPPFQTGQPLSFALAEKVAELLPADFNRVFFTNSGSESVDTALKVAMAYHRARSDGQRIRFVSRERAYHGVNIGGVSLSGMVRNRESFPVVMPNVVLMRHTWDESRLFECGQPASGVELADDLERICQTYGGSTVAAVIVEPVAGSTGTLVPPQGYLQRLRDICDRHGILLIFDEVITGFGRLGANFASQYFGVTPDIVTMAKALTNGAIPMGAVSISDSVYNTISGANNGIEFFHGYTYSAHPAACAAGLAALEIYADEGLFENSAALSDYFLDAVWTLKDLPIVRDIRGVGLMAGVEVHPMGDKVGARGGQLQTQLFNNGCHVKWTGDSAIVAPMLVSTKAHVDEIVGCIEKTLRAA